MELKEQKTSKVVDNSAFNDRFKFILSINDNIICERFFKINGFDYDAIYSERMKSLFVGEDGLQYGTLISMIVNDLKSKSRMYTWYTTETPVKLTGFMEGAETTYLEYTSKKEDEVEINENGEIEDNEPEIVKPFDITFKFSFQMAQKTTINSTDGKPVFSQYKPIYEVIWDGSVYPKFVRNSVDLSNSFGHKDKEIGVMNFVQGLTYRMTYDKRDLVYHIIREICDAATFNDENELFPMKKRRTVSYLTYGNKRYAMSDFDKDYIDGWRKAVEAKTKAYWKGEL